jgi:hypothetical protein
VLKHASSSLFTLAILTTSHPALAATKSFIVDGGLFQAVGADATFVGYGVLLGDAPDSRFAVNIILPKDFKKDSILKLQARLSVDEANCSVEFMPVSVIRNRAGFEQTGGGFGGSGTTIAAVPSDENKVFTITFKLNGSTGGTVAGQRAGDHLYIEYARLAESNDDTCAAALRATSIKVIYTAN